MRTVADIVADLRNVADYLPTSTYEWPDDALGLREAADLLERLDALRPTCPTCDGGEDKHEYVCPDCTDGRMPFERMAAIVTAVFATWPERQHNDISAWIIHLRCVRP